MIAKIAPLFVLLMVVATLAIGVMRVFFAVPVRGSMVLVALERGAVHPVRHRHRHVPGDVHQVGAAGHDDGVLHQSAAGGAFRIALTPVEAMPSWMQPITWLNPIRHFGIIARATLMKGSGIDVLWPNFLALIGFTVVLVSLSIWRFRKQLG